MPKCFQFIPWDLELLFYNDPIRAHLGVFLDFVDALILYKQILCLCAPFKTLYKNERSNKTMKTKCTHIFVHECICICIIFNTNARRTHKINTSLRIQCKIFKWYALLLLLFCFAVFVFVVLYCLVAAAASVWPRRPTFCAIELKCDDTRRGVYAGGVCVCLHELMLLLLWLLFVFFIYHIKYVAAVVIVMDPMNFIWRPKSETRCSNVFVAMQQNATASHASRLCLCLSV